MNRFYAYLGPAIRFCIRSPALVLGAGLALGVVGLVLALNLRIDNDFSKLLPRSYPSVQSLERLREQVGTTNEVAVVIESPSFGLNRTFAERLIPEAMALRDRDTGEPYFTRVEYRKETDFLKSNALWFATSEELELIETFLDEEIEAARLEANPFYFELDEEPSSADSLGDELQEAYDELVGSEYPISADSLTMAIRFFPAGSQTDIQYIAELYEDLDHLTARLAEEMNQPELSYVLAGRLLRTQIEIESIYLDVRDSFGAGVFMLLLLVIGYFYYRNVQIRSGGTYSTRILLSELARLPVTALIMGTPLGLSLCWTFGFAWLAFGTLNIMTSTLALLLFGMGIDFGIHFYGRYIEERSQGHPIDEAIETTFMTTGKAIAAVGITTSAAFFILMLADFKGFSEFGAIAGVGLLFSILAMTLLLPSLLILLERIGGLNTSTAVVPAPDGRDAPTIPPRTNHKVLSIGILLISVATTILSGWYARNLTFEYDFGSLEPVYESYNRVAQEARKVYSDRRTRNAAYIIADTPGEAIQIRDRLRERIEADTLSPTIESVETLQDRYPFTESEKRAKLDRIEGVRGRLNDPFLSTSDSEQYRMLQDASSTTEPIELEEVPEFLLQPFTARDGTIGNLVIIYPSVALSDGRNSMNFADDLSHIELSNGTVYNAASTSIVASDMLRLMIEETPRMVALTLTFIILIKLVIFRSLKWMVLALLPLVASFLWLFGLMDLAGWKLNFYNIVVLPTILGIGDDSGIHIVHRYLEEGKGSIYKVIRSTGEHVTVSSLTTLLGFAGLLFSNHPGMRSIGELAVAGIALMLIASLVLLPAVLYLLERWDRIKNI